MILNEESLKRLVDKNAVFLTDAVTGENYLFYDGVFFPIVTEEEIERIKKDYAQHKKYT